MCEWAYKFPQYKYYWFYGTILYNKHSVDFIYIIFILHYWEAKKKVPQCGGYGGKFKMQIACHNVDFLQ
jgi:hypothetical protein